MLLLIFGSCVFLLLANTSGECSAEILVQDVLWTRPYDEIFEENYYGTCRFVPTPCGTNNDGVCVPKGKCSSAGGATLIFGGCQDGIGECCTFTQRCNENLTVVNVDKLVTVLESPIPSDNECTFNIRKETNICQVRLDFETYSSARADSEGNCLEDRLHIRNSITIDRDFNTCGDLSGQHMYLTFGSQDTIQLTPLMKSANSRYKIVVTKIPCQSRQRAPDYCLQYYTKATDIVKSFDFGGQQQSHQQYSACVRPHGQSSGIQWKSCTSLGSSQALNIISNVQASSAICNTDWLQVKGLEKICEPFHIQATTWKSYELLVHFDQQELPPPPPSFDSPVDNENCEASCVSQPGAYICACLPNPDLTNQICQCVVDTPLVSVQADLNNTGFCLEYSQF